MRVPLDKQQELRFQRLMDDLVLIDVHQHPMVMPADANEMPADFRVSITNAPGNTAYPISSFTWILIPSHIADANKAKAIKAFLQWMLADGQKMTAALAYAPLPKEVVAKETKQIAQIQ